MTACLWPCSPKLPLSNALSVTKRLALLKWDRSQPSYDTAAWQEWIKSHDRWSCDLTRSQHEVIGVEKQRPVDSQGSVKTAEWSCRKNVSPAVAPEEGSHGSVENPWLEVLFYFWGEGNPGLETYLQLLRQQAEMAPQGGRTVPSLRLEWKCVYFGLHVNKPEGLLFVDFLTSLVSVWGIQKGKLRQGAAEPAIATMGWSRGDTSISHCRLVCYLLLPFT